MEIKINNSVKTLFIGLVFIYYIIGNVVCCQGSQIIILKNNGESYKNYTKIQYAIDSASDGDTIYISNGTYHENLIINKSISIIGENRENTIIKGDGTEILIHVSEKNVNISRITFINGNIGIYVKGRNNVLSNTSISNVSLLNNNVSI